MRFKITDFHDRALEEVQRLNDTEIPHVSQITLAEWRELAAQAIYFRGVEVAGQTAAFLLGLDQSAAYESLNFQWFRKRYRSFVYIDRVVIAKGFQRQGLGSLLYNDVSEFSRGRAPLLTCEVNLRPPNPGSLEFHARMGFREVGQQETEGGKKRVSLMAKEIDP